VCEVGLHIYISGFEAILDEVIHEDLFLIFLALVDMSESFDFVLRLLTFEFHFLICALNLI
jgi:hypothetical protein